MPAGMTILIDGTVHCVRIVRQLAVFVRVVWEYVTFGLPEQ